MILRVGKVKRIRKGKRENGFVRGYDWMFFKRSF